MLVALIFGIHAVIRFAGLWNTLFIPISLLILWPLPWMLSSKPGREAMRFRLPMSAAWWAIGPATALGTLGVCGAIVWVLFGDSDTNWLAQHAKAMSVALRQVPADASQFSRYLVVTVPAVLFSPLGEEFLYRGYMLAGFGQRWGIRTAMVLQASAFALVHLAHYGLDPLQPVLIVIWLPSMFAAALILGWIVVKSGSVWVGVLSHAVFNAGMNGLVFVWFPGMMG